MAAKYTGFGPGIYLLDESGWESVLGEKFAATNVAVLVSSLRNEKGAVPRYIKIVDKELVDLDRANERRT